MYRCSTMCPGASDGPARRAGSASTRRVFPICRVAPTPRVARTPRVGRASTVGPDGGPRPAAGPPEFHLTEQIDRSALRRPAGPGPAAAPGPAPTVYRSRRPGLIVLLVMGTAVVQLLLLFVLVHSMFSGKFAAGGMLASIFALTGVPLTAMGLYALVTGAPASVGGNPAQAWFRAPTAYLPVGLTLLIAAALAAS